MNKRRIAFATVGLAAVLNLPACGTDDEKSADEAATGQVAEVAPAAEAPAATEAAAAEPAPPAPGQDSPPSGFGRQLVITSSMTIETDDVGAAVQRLTAIAERNGGAVFASDVSLTDKARGTVQLRVPPAKLGGVKGEIAALGELVGQGQSTEDVTDQAVDVAARIQSAQASVDRVRGFYDRATTVKELTALEVELTNRQTELERLVAQQRSLQDRVGLATINVELFEPEAAPAPKVVAKPKKTTVGSALTGGLKALGKGANGLLIALAAMLPFLAVLAVLWLPGRVVFRRWRSAQRARVARTPRSSAPDAGRTVQTGRQPDPRGAVQPPTAAWPRVAGESSAVPAAVPATSASADASDEAVG